MKLWHIFWASALSSVVLAKDLHVDDRPLGIKIHAFIGQGLGWEGFSCLAAYHVIVTLTQGSSRSVPFEKILINTTKPINLTIEQGRGGFEDLENIDYFQAASNSMGRVSFSIPLDTHENMDMLPILKITARNITYLFIEI